MNKIGKNIKNACNLLFTKWIPSFGEDIIEYHHMTNYISKLNFIVKNIH